jgi:hypothetical protein
MIKLRLGSLVIGCWFLAVVVAVAEPPSSRVVLIGESEGKARRLKVVDQLITASQWAPAIEELLRLREEPGDDLAPVDANHSVQVRW